MTTTHDDELREIYRRCDISNNGTDNPLGEDEFVRLMKAREQAARKKVRDVAYGSGYKFGYGVGQANVRMNECQQINIEAREDEVLLLEQATFANKDELDEDTISYVNTWIARRNSWLSTLKSHQQKGQR